MIPMGPMVDVVASMDIAAPQTISELFVSFSILISQQTLIRERH